MHTITYNLKCLKDSLYVYRYDSRGRVVQQVSVCTADELQSSLKPGDADVAVPDIMTTQPRLYIAPATTNALDTAGPDAAAGVHVDTVNTNKINVFFGISSVSVRSSF